MRIFSTFLKKMNIFKNKRSSLIALSLIAASVLLIGGKALADWGPDRPTFTWGNPPSYVTFNSFTNNPVVGDERFFFSGNITPGTNVVDEIKVKDGDVAHLRIHFHNNANPNLNLNSTNTRVKVALPKVAATKTWATALITSDNGNPDFIFDAVDFVGDKPFTLEYIPGSTVLHNNVFTNATSGAPLSDAIVTPAGAQVGYSTMNGIVPGGPQFSGFVNIKLKVKMPGVVTPAYACTLLNLTAQPNRKVDASVTYTSSGGATFKNVTFDWGDSNTTLTTNTSASHTYAKDDTYTVKATVKFDVSGTEQAATSFECSKQVTFTTPVTPPVVQPPAPTKLPVTGPGTNALAIFAGVSTFAGIFHYLWKGRKFDEFEDL